MLTHWNKLLNTDCVVLRTHNNKLIYPIFRNGYSSLIKTHQQKFINEEIGSCNHIDVVIRDPDVRFVSGVNEYCRQNSLDIKSTHDAIKAGQVVDRHFAPQYIWLLHLSKYYKGLITIRPFDKLNQYTYAHENRSPLNINVPILDEYVAVDKSLVEYYDKEVALQEIVRRYKDVLS